MKIRVWVETGFHGTTHEDIIEIDDEDAKAMTDKDFSDMAHDFMANVIEYGWQKID